MARIRPRVVYGLLLIVGGTSFGAADVSLPGIANPERGWPSTLPLFVLAICRLAFRGLRPLPDLVCARRTPCPPRRRVVWQISPKETLRLP